MKLFSESLPFYRGNLHAHTTCSDGQKTPKECMADYRAAGYDFLSITDHRMVTKPDPAEIPEGLVMIPGIELDYTMPDQWVHIQGLGVTEAVMDNYDRNGNPQDGIDRINECGGLAMLNHPAWSLNPPEYIASLKGVSVRRYGTLFQRFPTMRSVRTPPLCWMLRRAVVRTCSGWPMTTYTSMAPILRAAGTWCRRKKRPPRAFWRP